MLSHPRRKASFCDVRSNRPASSSSFASRPASELMSRAAFLRTATGHEHVLVTYSTRLISNRPHHCLFDPPSSVSRKLETFLRVELLHRLVKPKVPSWITSWKWRPRCWYLLQMETTNLKFALIIVAFARWQARRAFAKEPADTASGAILQAAPHSSSDAPAQRLGQISS